MLRRHKRPESENRSISRRTACKCLATLSAGGVLCPALANKGFSTKTDLRGTGSVLQVVDTDSNHGLPNVNAGVIQIMVDEGIKAFAGNPDVGEAWKTLFPGINRQSVIGIKINLIYYGGLCTHPEVSYAIAAGLQKMEVEGEPFPANNIIIWDRYGDASFTNAGYTINTGTEGVRCFGSARVGYDSTVHDVYGAGVRLSRILTDHCDFLINVCIPKDHNLAGITLSLKNTFGIPDSPALLHPNRASPYIAFLYNLPEIRNKTVLNICDAIFGIYSQGPTSGWTSKAFIHDSIYFSTDPVALDYVLRQVINGVRSEYGISPVAAPHIEAAGTLGLGTTDPGQMTVARLVNPSQQPTPTPGRSSQWLLR